MFYSIDDARKNIAELKKSLEQGGERFDSEIMTLITAIESIFDIAKQADQKQDVLTNTEITEIGDQAISLIDNLIYKLGSKKSDAQHQLALTSLTITQWLVNHNGTLNNIRIIVDALAFLANTVKEQSKLAELADFMTKIAHACSSDIVNDLDNANPSRPWRILNLNRGIVATRSLNLEVMNVVFPEIIKAIPLDAPEFFKEGLSEMVRLNYPNDVAAVMQHYHEQTTLPQIH